MLINSFMIWQIFFTLLICQNDVPETNIASPQEEPTFNDNETVTNSSETTLLKTDLSNNSTATKESRKDIYSFLCAVSTSEESSDIETLLSSILKEIDRSHQPIISQHDCGEIYDQFVHCYKSYSELQLRSKNDSHLLTIGPFCVMLDNDIKFRNFNQRYFHRRSLNSSFMIFSTAFNFIQMSDDGYKSYPATNENDMTTNQLVMLLGTRSFYAEGVWHLMTVHFRWKRFVLVRIIGNGVTERYRDQSCTQLFASLQRNQLSNSDVEVEEYPWYLNQDDALNDDNFFKNIWLTIAKITRIIYLCADIMTVVKFLKQIVVNNVTHEKYGVIVMKSTIADEEYFVDSLTRHSAEKMLTFVKILTYHIPLCKDYNNTYQRKALENKTLEMNERHEMIKFGMLVGMYYCAVKSYSMHLKVRDKSLSFQDSFIKYYRPNDSKVIDLIKQRVIFLPVLILHTYDYESRQFVEALKIQWTVHSNFQEARPLAVAIKSIKWSDNDEVLKEAPYFCNNRSSFYQCHIQKKGEPQRMNVGYFILISVAVLIMIVIICLLCIFFIVFYNKIYLRRRWFVRANCLSYKEDTHVQNYRIKGTTHFGTYKKVMKVIIFDVKTSLDKNVLESKEVLQEAARIAFYTRTNSKFAKFIGYTYSLPSDYKLVYEIGRGTNLTRILRSVKLAIELKFSLIRDLALAMEDISRSFLKYHGDLRPDRCIIDERFILRVTITRFPKVDTMNRANRHTTTVVLRPSLLWTAPEIIRNPNLCSSEATDVYSFSIIVHEIVYQRGPFYVQEIHGNKHDRLLSASHFQTKLSKVTTLEQDDSCALIVIGNVNAGPLRPTIPEANEKKKLKELDSLMIECWQECPEGRPKFNEIVTKLQTYMELEHIDVAVNTGKRLKTVSRNMVRELMQKKRCAIKERDQALKYLTHLMPGHFGYEFMIGHFSDLQPEYFDNVTIYFNDLVKFASILPNHRSYATIVEILDELFIAYDNIVSFYDVVPLHRVGSSLLLASGVPHKNDKHVSEIAQCALQIRHFAKTYQRDKLNLRAGIHTGAVMSGFVGKNIPQFGLFGDTVNTASRMLTSSEFGEIQITESVQKLLALTKQFVTVRAGEKQIKGKGRMKTFWLKGYNKYPSIPLNRRLDDLPRPCTLANTQGSLSSDTTGILFRLKDELENGTVAEKHVSEHQTGSLTEKQFSEHYPTFPPTPNSCYASPPQTPNDSEPGSKMKQ